MCVCVLLDLPLLSGDPVYNMCSIELACAAQVINSQPSQKIFYTPPFTVHLPPLCTITRRHPVCASTNCVMPIHPSLSPFFPSVPPSSIRPTWCPAPTLNKQQFILRRKKGAHPLSFGSLSVEVCLLCVDSSVPVDVFSPNSPGPYLTVK